MHFEAQRIFPCVLAAIVTAACGDNAPYGLTGRKAVTTLTFPTDPPSSSDIDVVDAFPALTFHQPVLLTHPPDGTDRIFVVELRGVIHVFDNDPSVDTTDVFLDLSGPVPAFGEAGLLGLAFHPDYAQNGFFYVHYSAPTTTTGAHHRSVISRFEVDAGNPNAANPASETVLLSFDQPFYNHNGGMLAFGPDGMLYAAVGDGGGHHDPNDRAQDLTVLLGKVLRLTPEGGIPPDNPFVGKGGDVREEIWAYGFRNPWRFSFDRLTGDLWLGDVGQDHREEVDVVRKGDNHGWDLFEGTREHENPGNVSIDETARPVFEYGRSEGQSVTGGHVYRGSAVPLLEGAYVYGDFISGRVWALVVEGQQVQSNVEIAFVANPAGFGEDEAGEVYACSFDGRIYRFEEAGGASGQAFPERLSDTGLFQDTDDLVPANGLIEYDVNAPLWSDGVEKRRWIALPGYEQIDFHPTEAWGFPLGTVLVKHFEVATAPGVTRRLETRVLLHGGTGWRGYTYKWNAQQTDADLLDGSDVDVVTILDGTAPGGHYELTWNYPSGNQCLECHTVAAGRVLGVRTRQMNRGFDYPATSDNQLRAWDHIRLFTSRIGDHGDHDKLPKLDSIQKPVADRARAYLAANCSYCHRPGGPTPADIDLRYGIAPSQMNVILAVPSSGDLGIPGAFIVDPGSKETSVLWARMLRLGSDRMPALGSDLVHQEAVGVVGQWIDDGAN